MNKSYDDIQRYLSELKSALQGQPAGMVQDALYDVENHLLEALANEDNADIAALITEFGTPQELAAQYIQFEEDSLRFLNGTVTKEPKFNGFFAPLTNFKDYKALSYFFVSFPLGIVYFGWLMLFGAPALILSVTIIGLPFLALFLKSQAYLALVEGQLINTFLGIRMPRRPSRAYKRDSSKSYSWQSILDTLKSPQNWRIAFYSLLHLPLSATYFFAVCVLFFASLALIVSPILDPIIHAFAPHLAIDINWYWLPVTSIVGVIGLTLSMHVARLLTSLHSSIASYLLIQR